MTEFKIGDTIRARESWGESLTEGKEYEVVDFWSGGIRIISDTGDLCGFYEHRFDKVEQPTETFKVGDKVITHNPKIICEGYRGEVGVVVEILGREDIYGQRLRIEYDNGETQIGNVIRDSLKRYEKVTFDIVAKPTHYNQEGIECIDAIKAALGKQGFVDYCHGNVMKYMWRYKYKNGIEDLKKADKYKEWMNETLEEIDDV